MRGMELLDDEENIFLEEESQDDDKCGFWSWIFLIEKFDRLFPLKDDVRWAASQYGSGVQVFIAFYRFVVLSTFLPFVAWMYPLILQSQALPWSNSNELRKGLCMPGFGSETDVVYSCSIALCTLLLFLITLAKFSEDYKQTLSMVYSETKQEPKRFSILLFNCNNFKKCQSRRMSQDFMTSNYMKFKIELKQQELEDLRKDRTIAQWRKLYARRVLGIIVNILSLFASWFAILKIVQNNQTIPQFLIDTVGPWTSSFASFVPAMFITGVSTLLPTITFAVIDFEKWDSAVQIMRNQTVRLYLGSMMTLLVQGISYYSLAKGNPIILETFFREVVSGLKSSLKAELYDCNEGAAAESLFMLVLSDFVTRKVIHTATALSTMSLNRCCKWDMKLAEYVVSVQTIEVLYQQGLMWMTMPIYPFVAWLM